jgi:hypothetical protein
MTRSVLAEADVELLVSELIEEAERLVAAAAVVEEVADRLRTTTRTAARPLADGQLGSTSDDVGDAATGRTPSRSHRSTERSPPLDKNA